MKNNPRAALENVFKELLQKALPEGKEKEGLIKDLAPKLAMTCMGKMGQGKSLTVSLSETINVAMLIVHNQKQKQIAQKNPANQLEMEPMIVAMQCAIVLSQVDELRKFGINPALALSHLGKFDPSVVGDSALQELTVEKAAGQAQEEGQRLAESAEWDPAPETKEPETKASEPKTKKTVAEPISLPELAAETVSLCEGMKADNTLGASRAPTPSFGASGG